MGILSIKKNHATLVKMGSLEHKQLLLLAYGLYRAGAEKAGITDKDLDDMIAMAKKHAR